MIERRIARVRVNIASSAGPSPIRTARCNWLRSSVNRPSISSTASRLVRNTSRHITGSLAERTEAGRAADPRRDLEASRDRFRTNPGDVDAALQYGKALRATGQKSQAAAVLEQATIAHPGNKALLAGYGRALADNGSFQPAFDVLTRAHTPEDPDWRILSAQGAVLDQLGRYEEARQYYSSALKTCPKLRVVQAAFPTPCKDRQGG